MSNIRIIIFGCACGILFGGIIGINQRIRETNCILRQIKGDDVIYKKGIISYCIEEVE